MICPFDQSTGRARPAHIIDVSTKDGLLDMIALGNVIELSRALDQRHYTGYDIDDHEQDEIDAVMTRYRLFIRWYTQNFALLIQKDWISPSYLFKKRLVDFASTVLLYVREQEGAALQIDTEHTLTSKAM